MTIFQEIISKYKEYYIQDLEDLIRTSKYGTNSIQDHFLEKVNQLKCINDDFNYDPKSIDLVEEFATEIKEIKINTTPLIERLGGDFLEIMIHCQEAYAEFFEDAEEIGSSDVNCFLISHLSNQGIDHKTVSKEDWMKMKRWGCC